MGYKEKLAIVTKEIMEKQLINPGKVYHAAVSHDNDCEVWAKGADHCNCDVDIAIYEHKEPVCGYCTKHFTKGTN